MTEAVELDPYDPAWSLAFEAERGLLELILGLNALRIEHMGSTSVPGLPAKPIIDIIVLVRDLAKSLEAVPSLEAIGYSYWADNPDKSKLFLVRGLPPAPRRTHHLHIHDDANEVSRHLIFRDRLRADPETREAYLTLKTELALRYRNDREAYSKHKSAFVDAVVGAVGGPPRKVAFDP